MAQPDAPRILFDAAPADDARWPRVLVVTNMYPHPARPFLGIFVQQQVESLRAMGVAADVLFVNGPADHWNYLRGVGAYWSALRRRNYQLVHAHYVYAGVIARLQLGRPVLTTFHSGEFYSGRLQSTLSRWLAPRIDRVILVSGRLREFLPGRDAVVLPCGVDTNLFRPTPQDTARAALGLARDRKYVLFAAARRPEKRFDLVQQAALLLRERVPEAELLIVSGEPPERVPLYMNAADVLVLASDKEGSPQVVKEAMACNLPIVSVPVGDVDEVIGKTDGCFLCTQSPGDIAATLERALRRGGRTTGREVVAHLSLERVAERLVALYEEVLRRRGVQRPQLRGTDPAIR